MFYFRVLAGRWHQRCRKKPGLRRVPLASRRETIPISRGARKGPRCLLVAPLRHARLRRLGDRYLRWLMRRTLLFGKKPNGWCANQANNDHHQREAAKLTPSAKFRELAVRYFIQPTAEASQVRRKSTEIQPFQHSNLAAETYWQRRVNRSLKTHLELSLGVSFWALSRTTRRPLPRLLSAVNRTRGWFSLDYRP